MPTTNKPTCTASAGTATLLMVGGRGMKIAKITWVSTAGGIVTAILKNLGGRLLRMSAFPDAGNTQPTNEYDVTLIDNTTEDVLGTAGANLSNAAVVSEAPMLTGSKALSDGPMVCHGPLTLNIAAAGAAKGGILYLFFGDVLEQS